MLKIKVGTFNLFQFVEPPYAYYNKKDKFNLEEWRQKTQWIKNQILAMDCDIIGFQEVFSHKALRVIVKDLGFKYFKIVDVAKLNKKNKQTYVTTTVAIASKYPISNIQVVEAHLASIESHDLQRAFKFSRIPIKAIISLPNKKELLVYVCHLKSNRLNAFEYTFSKNDTLAHKKTMVSKSLQEKYSSSLRQRLCEASSLFFDIEKYKKIPTILLCDLNDKEFSITIDALINHKYHEESSQKEAILYDASYHYQEEIYNPHPEAKEPKRKSTSYFLAKGNVLDYIFISKDLSQKVSNYKVLDKHLEENKNGSLLQSDHAQVVCELVLE